jgi:hypothetical protein
MVIAAMMTVGVAIVILLALGMVMIVLFVVVIFVWFDCDDSVDGFSYGDDCCSNSDDSDRAIGHEDCDVWNCEDVQGD